SYNEKSKGEGVGDWRPRTLHQERRHPERTLTTSVEGSGSSIGGPDPESTGDSDSRSLVDSRLEPQIGDPEPSTK
ncbi:hypothetical protein CRG98_048967, partial [Punica granatum]